MNLFFAVERVTAGWLRKQHSEAKHANLKCNVELKTVEFACLTLGAVIGSSTSITVAVSLPALTNPNKLRKGDRLLLEVAPPPREKRKAETWKTHVAQAEKAAKHSERQMKAGHRLPAEAKW